MAQHPRIDLQVAYCCLRGAHSDPEFATSIQWDIPLLDGYNWVEIPNIGKGTESFLGLCNPGLWRLIRRNNFDAVFCHTGYLKASFWIAVLAARLGGSVFPFGTDANSLALRDSHRVGATTDLIAPVNPDFIFSCGDVHALTELLQRALSDPTELARRGQDALRRMQSWSARENISGVLEAVERVLSRVRAKRAVP